MWTVFMLHALNEPVYVNLDNVMWFIRDKDNLSGTVLAMRASHGDDNDIAYIKVTESTAIVWERVNAEKNKR